MSGLDFTRIRTTSREMAALCDDPPALWNKYGYGIPERSYDAAEREALRSGSSYGRGQVEGTRVGVREIIEWCCRHWLLIEYYERHPEWTPNTGYPSGRCLAYAMEESGLYGACDDVDTRGRPA